MTAGAPDVRYAKSGDVTIAYTVVGDGPFDVVFVSGWVLSTLDVAWEGPAREFFDRMSSFCRLILFDKRGTGLSDRTTGIPDLQTRMDDIRAVMDAAGSKRAAIMGFSEGGPMTLLFASTYPERTAATVLFGTAPTYIGDDDYPWSPRREEWPAELDGIAAEVGTQAWIDKRRELFAPSFHGDEALVRWWKRWVQTSASPGAALALATMNSGIDVRPTLPVIRVPTLVLHRVDDETTVLDEGRYLADRIADARLVELPGRDHGWWIDPGQLVTEIQPFLQDLWDRGEWDAVRRDRVLATVMFTDIVQSTEKLAELGDRRWQEILAKHHEVVRRQLTRFSGREVDTAGDGFFATFDGPARAIRCASAITGAVSGLGLQVRAGLHTGECEVVDRKVAGIAVHIGARVAGEAAPGEVLVSSTVKDLVAGSGIEFAERGVASLKGIPGEWRLYAVERAG